MSSFDPLKVNENNIWRYPQNKPSRIAMWFQQTYKIPMLVTYQVLMANGVFKWLAIRRDLIQLKNTWKHQITALYDIKVKRDTRAYWYERGYREALEQCRADVRALCHGPRWQFPDHDPKCRIPFIQKDT